MFISVMLNMKHLMPGKEVRMTSETAIFGEVAETHYDVIVT